VDRREDPSRLVIFKNRRAAFLAAGSFRLAHACAKISIRAPPLYSIHGSVPKSDKPCLISGYSQPTAIAATVTFGIVSVTPVTGARPFYVTRPHLPATSTMKMVDPANRSIQWMKRVHYVRSDQEKFVKWFLHSKVNFGLSFFYRNGNLSPITSPRLRRESVLSANNEN
jgi:hypothetical protein